MRLAYLGNFSANHTEVDIADALEKRHEVWRYHIDMMDDVRFLRVARRFDAVITTKPQGKGVRFWEQVKKKGPKLIAWYFDWIWGYGDREKRYLPRLKVFDLVLSSDGKTDEEYKRHNIRRRYMMMGCRTDIYRSLVLTEEEKEQYSCDVGFVGHIYFDRRKRMIEGVSRICRFKMWGQNSDFYGHRHAVVANASKIMLADNYRNDIPGYWSNRVYLEVGSGALLLHPRVPLMERSFKDREHLVYWDNESDLHRKIHHYLRDSKEREKIAKQGQEHIHKYHSWDVRVERFERLCESALSLTPTSTLGSVASAGSSSSTSMPILSSL